MSLRRRREQPVRTDKVIFAAVHVFGEVAQQTKRQKRCNQIQQDIYLLLCILHPSQVDREEGDIEIEKERPTKTWSTPKSTTPTRQQSRQHNQMSKNKRIDNDESIDVIVSTSDDISALNQKNRTLQDQGDDVACQT